MILKNSHLFGIAALILALMSAGAAASGETPRQRNSKPLTVTIVSASTKKEWINDAAQAFNAASRSNRDFQIDGKRISIEIIEEETETGVWDHYRSGTMVTDILSGKIKPVAASPGEETWLRKLNSDWKATFDKAAYTDKPTPLLQTPVVIAMWQSRAEALGCWPAPTSQCTWRHLSELSADPRGWSAVGHPEWGEFRLGYGYVGESNSGTFSALMFCMVGLGKTTDLRLEDIDATNGCGQTLAKVEKAKVHSGIKSGWLLNWMKEKGQSYLDAAVTNEQDVIEFNLANSQNLPEPLVAAYPQDGTVIRDDPYVVLDQAPWVTAAQARAARLFQKYLLSDAQQRKLLNWGLRPNQAIGDPGPPFEPRLGAIAEPHVVAVKVPDVPVFDRLAEVWHETKKHAVIVLVVDRSGRIDGDKLESSKAGIVSFIEAMDPQDQLIWMPFAETIQPGLRGSVADIGPELIKKGKGPSETGGGAALYDAISQAYSELEVVKTILGQSVKYGIVVISDGRDTKSQTSFTQLRNRLNVSAGNPTGIQIHTIGIGKDARKDVLTIIATTAHGRYWDAADPKRLESIYTQIAKYY